MVSGRGWGKGSNRGAGCWLHSNCGCDSLGTGTGLGDLSGEQYHDVHRVSRDFKALGLEL